MFVKDPKTGEPSVTLTAFCIGFGVATLKLLLSGMIIKGITLSQFSGSDYGLAISALGGLYVLRRHPAMNTPEPPKSS